MQGRTALLTAAAMVCFAANSLLCRMALGPRLIDPASFTSVRVVSATAMLAGVVAVRTRRLPRIDWANWRSALALLVYLFCFSFAYVRLGAGTGALVLFGTVQFTMFTVALVRREYFAPRSWAALAVAVCGLVYLVLPGVAAPDPLGTVLMAGSGVAWGSFSLLARGVEDPAAANASAFLCCLPLVLLVNGALAGQFSVSADGIGFALLSGVVASGLGYVIWYAALRGLPRTHAAAVQLSVPVLAAFGGVILLSEPVTARLLIATVALLGGVIVILTQPTRVPKG